MEKDKLMAYGKIIETEQKHVDINKNQHGEKQCTMYREK